MVVVFGGRLWGWWLLLLWGWSLSQEAVWSVDFWFVTFLVPAIPEDLHVVTANTTATMVCFSWKQTGCYDEFNIQISLPNHGFKKNLTIPRNNVTDIDTDGSMWCITELPCPGAAYSLHVAAVSHGRRSNLQNLNFRPGLFFCFVYW